jgi:hypothetical protein
MYNNHQSYFLPDGLSNSSSSSIESAFNSISTGNSDIHSMDHLPILGGHIAPSKNDENLAFRRHLDHVINGKEG